MRKFSSKRLYKLCAVFVVLVTIFCIFGFIENIKISNEYSIKYLDKFGSCWKEYWDYVDAGKPANIDQWMWRNQHKNDKTALAQKDWCMVEPNVYYSTSKSADEQSKVEFYIAIFLPLLFFGGTLIYKFIFPIQNKN